MEQGFIRMSDDGRRSTWMPILHAMYEYESSKISGAHGGTRRLSEYAWTLEQMFGHLKNKFPQQNATTLLNDSIELIKHLKDTRQLLEIELQSNRLDEFQASWRDAVKLEDLGESATLLGENGMVRVYFTRMAEIVRTSGNVREYSRAEGLPRRTMIESTNWIPVLRPSLARTLEPDLIARELESLAPGNTPLRSQPNVTLNQAIDDLRIVLTALESGHAIGPNYKISSFQKQGIVEALKQSWFGGTGELNTSKGVVVAAGTGFGKTLAFAIPVLTDALIQTREKKRACTQVLLYPRNDLAVDQTNELNSYIRAINDKLHNAGQTNRNFGLRMDAASKIGEERTHMPGGHLEWGIPLSNVYEGAIMAYAGKNSVQSASIVVASIESFRRRFAIGEVVEGLGNSVKRIVIDEIHLNSGIQGAHIKRILMRLRQLTYVKRGKDDAVFNVIGASATIADAEGHLSSISHVDKKHVHLVEATPDDGAPLGILNHVLHQPRKGRSNIGSIVDVTSSLVHQRRGKLDSYEFPSRPTSPERIQKTIGFSDGHEVVGSWWSNLVRNEMTEEGKTGPNHHLENPYPHWFYQPLRLHKGGEDVCKSCSRGHLHPSPISVEEGELWTFTHMSNGSKGSWSSPIGLEEDHEHIIQGLGTCPHLEFGTCWWFVEREDINLVEKIESQEFKTNTMRSFRHTSKTRGEVSTAEGADQAFKKQGKYTAFTGLNVKENLQHDIAIATPTLEVGIDMSNVTEVLTHKAIRNVSSYRQKVGRAGREPGTDAVAMTILSKNAADSNHLRSPSRLVIDPIADPVPVATENMDVVKNQAYEAVWDYLAIKNLSIELIPPIKTTDIHGRDNLVKRFHNAANAVDDIDCWNYIMYAVGCNNAIAKQAGEHAKRHIELFLMSNTRVIDTNTGNNPTFIEWLAARRANDNYTGIPDPNRGPPDKWNQLESIRDNVEPHLNDEVKGFWENKNPDALKRWADAKPIPSTGNSFTDQYLSLFIQLCETLIPFPSDHSLRESLQRLWAKYQHRVGAYFSSVRRTVFSEVEEIRTSVPFASLDALFTNPSEISVRVTRSLGGGDFESDYLPMKETMAFVLPGMWSHRVFQGGNRYFANHGGDLELQSGNRNTYLQKFDTPETQTRAGRSVGRALGPSASNVPQLLPLEVDVDTQEYQLEFVGMKRDRGFNSRQAMVQLGHVDGDNRFWADEAHASPGTNRTMKRPDSYSVSWVLTNEPDPESIKSVFTYIASDDLVPVVAQNAELGVSVTSHPLLSKSSIDVHHVPNAVIKRIALGVSRSNGIRLQPYINYKPIVWTDNIQTSALRFVIPSSMIHRLTNFYCDGERLFDNTVLQIFGHYLIEQLKWSPIDVEPFLDLLVAIAYINPDGSRNLPLTLDEAFDRLFNQGRIATTEILGLLSNYHLPDDKIEAENLNKKLNEMHDEFPRTKPWEIFDELTTSWVQTNAGNGLGMLLKELVAELAGTPTSSVGYTFSFDDENNLILTIFDDDAAGNGCVNLAVKYFHLPRESREIAVHHVPQLSLPDLSLMDLLEQRLNPCMNHIANTIAINDTDATRVPHLKNTIFDLRRRHSSVWRDANVTSTREANLMQRIAPFVANEISRSVDALEDAFDVCDSGCLECQSDGSSNLFSPLLNEYTQNKELIERLILGTDGQLPNGYKLEIRERLDILNEAGTPIGSTRIGARNPVDNRSIWKAFQKSTGERVMMYWPRRSDFSNVDWVVRTQEVID